MATKDWELWFWGRNWDLPSVSPLKLWADLERGRVQVSVTLADRILAGLEAAALLLPFCGASETQASAPHIGPVTLTSDPAVFQRELRELYVQSMPEAKVFAPPRGREASVLQLP
ncbi:hypothetical protein MC885_006698 [Smutsia gigantea]|nr:hypothetical protein MC885_006698 [Smutsia gigantea]